MKESHQLDQELVDRSKEIRLKLIQLRAVKVLVLLYREASQGCSRYLLLITDWKLIFSFVEQDGTSYSWLV